MWSTTKVAADLDTWLTPHTHITELLRVGTHPKVVSERAGYTSVAFTLQRYAHALPDMQQDAADQAQKLVGALVTK